MKKITKIGFSIATILIILAIKSCAELKLTNTSKGKFDYFYRDPTATKVVAVNVAISPFKPLPQEEEKPKMIWDLRDSIPHSMIQQLGKVAKTPDELIKVFSNPVYIPPKRSKTLETDFRDIRLKFILSNIKYYYDDETYAHFNNRLERLNATISLEETPNAYFYTFDRFENQFETIDMGTIDRTNEVKIETKLSGEMGAGVTATATNGNLNSNSDNSDDGNGNTKTQKLDKNRNNTNAVEAKSGYKAEASYANNEMLKEALRLNAYRLKAGYSFTKKNFTISQQAVPLRDILENAYIVATIRFKNNPTTTIVKENDVMIFSNLFDEKGKAIKADDTKVEFKRVKYLDPRKIPDIKLCVEYSGAIRAVKNQNTDNNILEGDDKISIHSFNDKISPDAFELGDENYGRRIYNITAEINGETHVLFYTRGNIIGKKEIVFFEEYDPREFLEWIEMAIKKPSANILQTDRFALFFGPYQLVGEEMNDKNKLSQLKLIKQINLEEIKEPAFKKVEISKSVARK